MKNYTKDFTELNKTSANIAGGKGASLGEMTQARIPVPDGFVILSTTFDQFIKDADLTQEIDAILDKVDHKEIHTVENASEKIQGLVKNAVMPENIAEEIRKQFKNLNTKYVAVRSSATAEDGQEHAWAGQLDSFLNTTEKDLLEKVQHCWASLFTPRAIFYRFEKGLDATQISVAVVVQKMINSEFSGIAFSVHPVTEDRNQLIIEAGFGLGEAIVSGQITPDSYVVEKEPRKIIDINNSTQGRGLYRVENGGNEWLEIKEPKASSQVLNEKQILELSDIILGIENHYGFPCDIEWAFDDGEFYIVQSRPITTLTSSDTHISSDLSDRYLKLIGKRKLYPPLNNYSAFLQGSEYNTQKYYKKWYGDKVRLDLFIHMKAGYSQVWLPENDLMIASEFTFREYLNDFKFFERRGNYILESIKNLDKIYDQYTHQKINNTDWNNLFPLINEVRDIMWDVNAAVIFTIYLDKKLCADILKKEKYSISEKELDVLWEKAVEPAFESFDKSQLNNFLKLTKDNNKWDEIVEKCQYILADYHSVRTLSEVEKVLNDRYAKYIDNPKLAEKALELETEHINEVVASHEKWLRSLPENERVIAHYLQTVMRIRDRRKNFFAKGMTIIYRIAERMFSEAKIEHDLIPYYTVHELLKGIEYLQSSVGTLRDRKNGFQWIVPYVGAVQGLNINIDSGVEKINKYFKDSHSSVENSDTIQGQSGFKGVVRGQVRIVLNVNSDHGFTDGEILVAGMTRPEYVPLMKKASAIITDEGGITCHAAIISRELKIPCVIGTKIATKVLNDGDLVEVDANNGVVKIIEKAKK